MVCVVHEGSSRVRERQQSEARLGSDASGSILLRSAVCVSEACLMWACSVLACVAKDRGENYFVPLTVGWS